ncbi:erythromycin esterase [Streptomyces griseocarneus]|nr:erythromycin esterase [Streptomyces griseocarneus]
MPVRTEKTSSDATSPLDPFAAWLREHTTALTGLDPDAPLDDLEPLRDIVGDARVVALGESSHFIEEFGLARRRLVRFLVERCGFGLLAFEYGFSEGFALDTWTRGEGVDGGLEEHLEAAIPIGLAEQLHELRRHNRTTRHPVRFAGVDIPAAGGSLLPSLTPLTGYLRDVDPDLLPLLEKAMATAGRFAGTSGALAAPAWSRLESTEQDALSADLARLLTRFRSLEPLYVERGGRYVYDVALRRLEGACAADYSFRAMAGLFAGTGLPADTSARDAYMAGSVLWHLAHAAPGTRMVLAAHNAHIQRTPVSFDGRLTGLPMGHYLHHALGDDYVALGITSSAGRTAEMRLDESARFGFVVDDMALEPPERGSVEGAFDAAGVGLGIAGFRSVPVDPAAGPDRVRIQASYLHTPVLEAFDGVLHVPWSTVVPSEGF